MTRERREDVKEDVVFGPPDERSLGQLRRCREASGEQAPGVLCADHHLGYSMPIGGVLAFKTKIMPAGVGYDIACGNCAVQTDLRADEIDTSRVMDEIATSLSFGVGRKNRERVDDPVLDKIAHAEVKPQAAMITLASNQLGTIGSGNHYVDLFRDESGALWVGVHFGSRGFGHKTATGFLALASGKDWGDRVSEGGMESAPLFLDVDSPTGQDYLAAMALAGEYAYAGRNWVVDKVLRILGATERQRVHNHHNFAWWEEHFGERYLVVRKGATPAFPGQRGFVGGSMGEDAVIVSGVDSPESRAALYSTVHGAGRAMSRRAAAGKTKWQRGRDGRKRPVRVSTGRVDWPSVQARLRAQGIELRGGAADEAPEAYKRLSEVLTYHEGTVVVEHTLTPIGVAMAGANEVDPYRD